MTGFFKQKNVGMEIRKKFEQGEHGKQSMLAWLFGRDKYSIQTTFRYLDKAIPRIVVKLCDTPDHFSIALETFNKYNGLFCYDFNCEMDLDDFLSENSVGRSAARYFYFIGPNQLRSALEQYKIPGYKSEVHTYTSYPGVAMDIDYKTIEFTWEGADE